MKPLTVKELYNECEKQIEKGNGNKVIMLSDDDEGNGYHYCWYAFSEAKDILIEDYMLNTEISAKDDTIILG